MIEPTVHSKAKRKDFAGTDKHKAINKTSGGMGKKEASAKVKANKAVGP